MIKQVFFIASSFCLGMAASAQTFDFHWATKSSLPTVKATSSDDASNGYSLTYDNNIYYYLRKQDPQGVVAWNNTINFVGTSGIVNDIATDRLGNTYLTGYYFSDYNGAATTYSLHIGTGSFPIPANYSAGNIGHKMFFAKVDVNGNLIKVGTYCTETDNTIGHSVTTDENNNAYLLSEGNPEMNFTTIPSFPVQYSHPLFILKINSDYVAQYATIVTDNYTDFYPGTSAKNEISANANGEVVITQTFSGTKTFNPTGTPVTLTSYSNSQDVFVAKYNAAGSMVWIDRFGGTGMDKTCSVMMDNAGNVYHAGLFSGTVDFNPGAGTLNKMSNGGMDMYMISLTGANTLNWANSIGGPADELEFAFTKAANNLYLRGSFVGTIDFNPGTSTQNMTSAGSHDIFDLTISSITGASSAMHRIGSTGTDKAFDICVNQGPNPLNLYTAGQFQGTFDFDPSSLNTYNLTASGTSGCVIKNWIQTLPKSMIINAEETISVQKAAVFPNPFIDYLTVTLPENNEKGKMTIYAIDGTIVFREMEITNNNQIDLSSLISGIYMIELISSDAIYKTRIVKN